MKTRPETRTRHVPHTVNGDTRMVPDEYTVHVPVPPRDWDRIVSNGVTGAAAFLMVTSVIWSTASVGDLLARAVFFVIAYSAAVAFDLVWMACMGLEWLSRYNPERARLPRRAGHAALAVAMAAVCVHGWKEDSLEVGFASAAVSALAKGLWTLVLKHQARPLDARNQAWLMQREGEIGAELALSAQLRRLEHTKAQHAALTAGWDPDADPESPEEPADDPDEEHEPPQSGPMTIADAVRNAHACGIHDPDAVLRYVRKVADANAKPETVARYVRAVRRSA